MGKKSDTDAIKIIKFVLLFDPIILAAAACFMKHYLSFQPPSQFYEGNEVLRMVQYFLYLSGLGVFFFNDWIINTLKKRILTQNDYSSLIRFVTVTMAIYDYIGLSGFVGFLISGNLTWVMTFCIISFFSRIRFVFRDTAVSYQSTG